MLILEIWKPIYINAIKTEYIVSSDGRIYNKRLNKLVNMFYNHKGYLMCSLYIHKLKITSMNLVHRLVAKAFIPNTDNKPQVNHMNGIKDDNRIENLEWVTNNENIIHATENNLRYSKLSVDDVHSICEYILLGYSDKLISKLFNVSESNIYYIRTCKIWKRIVNKYKFTKHERYVLLIDQVHMICKMLEEKIPVKEIAEKFKTYPQIIRNIKYRKNWKSISKYYNF